jgi:type I restriction enzyme, S subunit
MVRPGYKQTDVGVIPEEWGVVTLGKASSDIGDGIHATPVYSPNGDYYFINGNNLSNGHIVVTSSTKAVAYSESAKYRSNLGKRTILL